MEASFSPTTATAVARHHDTVGVRYDRQQHSGARARFGNDSMAADNSHESNVTSATKVRRASNPWELRRVYEYTRLLRRP